MFDYNYNIYNYYYNFNIVYYVYDMIYYNNKSFNRGESRRRGIVLLSRIMEI